MMNAGAFFRDLRDQYKRDEVDARAAALAYYATFSIVPMMLLAIVVGGLFFGEGTTQQELMTQLENVFGPAAASFVAESVSNSSQLEPSGNILATIVGFVLVFVGATKFFVQFQRALNRVWEVEPDPHQGLGGVVKKRVASFGVLLVVGLLMLVSTVASALISAFVDAIAIPGGPYLVEGANLLVTLVLAALLLAVIYKYFPDAEVRWSDVRVGAFVTALLLLIGKFAIGLYIGRGSMASTYGAAASIIIFLFWVYYSMQIVLIGAEFTQVWANQHGRSIVRGGQPQPA